MSKLSPHQLTSKLSLSSLLRRSYFLLRLWIPLNFHEKKGKAFHFWKPIILQLHTHRIYHQTNFRARSGSPEKISTKKPRKKADPGWLIRILTMVYEIIPTLHNGVVFHPPYALNNQGPFFHSSLLVFPRLLFRWSWSLWMLTSLSL